MGDVITFVLAIKAIIGWIPDVMNILMSEPSIYFVALAMVGGIAKVTKSFVPMRRR